MHYIESQLLMRLLSSKAVETIDPSSFLDWSVQSMTKVN